VPNTKGKVKGKVKPKGMGKHKLVTLKRRADFNAIFNRTQDNARNTLNNTSANKFANDRDWVKVLRFHSNEAVVLARSNAQSNNLNPDSNPNIGYRFGIVASKKVGKAVQRNKIRRRIKEIVRLVLPSGLDLDIEAGRVGFDIVIIAKQAAAEATFADLREGLEGILRKLIK